MSKQNTIKQRTLSQKVALLGKIHMMSKGDEIRVYRDQKLKDLQQWEEMKDLLLYDILPRSLED